MKGLGPLASYASSQDISALPFVDESACSPGWRLPANVSPTGRRQSDRNGWRPRLWFLANGQIAEGITGNIDIDHPFTGPWRPVLRHGFLVSTSTRENWSPAAASPQPGSRSVRVRHGPFRRTPEPGGCSFAVHIGSPFTLDALGLDTFQPDGQAGACPRV